MTGIGALSNSMADAYIGGKNNKMKIHPQSNVPINILHDPRVFHGNTRSIARKYTDLSELSQKKKNLSKVKRKLYEDKEKQYKFGQGHPIYDVKVIDPLKKVIDFSSYLEEQKPLLISHDNETQTDEFYEREVAPNVIPGKVGIDNCTEVQADLFDWDQEVTTIVDTLASKILEQGLLEVEQEEELKEIEKDNVAATGVKEYKDHEVLAMEVEKREEIEAKHKLYRDARLVYRAEKRLASKVFGIQLFREELPKLFTSLYENFELTETWISPSRQEELLKKEEKEKQQEIDKQNRQVVDEMIRSIIERAFEKQVEAQQSTKK